MLTIEPWVQIGTDALSQDATIPSITTNLHAHTWDAGNAPSMEAWQ
jgi:hypothetical protein